MTATPDAAPAPPKGAGIRARIQQVGGQLAGMVMPNIGAFIAWGIITALFIETGWWPNEGLASMVGPMITFLLPLLIGYTGGRMVHGQRGAVIGAIAVTGVAVGSEVPQFLGAMIMGPIAAYVLKKFDEVVVHRVKSGFEMLVNNFSLGIIGMLFAIIGYLAVGPAVDAVINVLSAGVEVLVNQRLLPLISILIEPAKVLFLNNAINHGVLAPIGVAEAQATGESILFMIETNPGPGLGVLLAFWMAGPRAVRPSVPGAAIIHFFGGIHEIYFPYVLMKPQTIIGAIAGGATGVLTFLLMGVGLVATPAPGSIFAWLAVTPRGNFLGVLLGITTATVVSFVTTAAVLRFSSTEEEVDVEEAKAKSKRNKNVKTQTAEA